MTDQYTTSAVEPLNVTLDSVLAAKEEFERHCPKDAFEPIRVTQKQLDNLKKIAHVWMPDDGQSLACDHFRGARIVIDEENPTYPLKPLEALAEWTRKP